MTRIRPAVADDAGFLTHMLTLAADWRPGAAVRTEAETLADPALAHYVTGWPRPGDGGVVALEAAGHPLGAAWFRCFEADHPGFGFISPTTPEVSIAVLPAARRTGVGTALMVALVDTARARAIPRLSLSVEVDNPARRLYERLGFTVCSRSSGAVTMVLEIAAAQTHTGADTSADGN